MNPLAVVESYLGSVERWPSSLLMDMFTEESKARVIRRLAAFMYGNYVTVSDAVACFNACNGMNRSYVDSSLKVWDRDEIEAQEGCYYSTVLKRWVWINGRRWNSVKCPQLQCVNLGRRERRVRC